MRNNRRMLPRLHSALFCCLVSGWLWAHVLPNEGAVAAEPLKVLFDADIDGDNDDVAAVAILHSFADERLVDILAMGVVSRCPHSPACLDAINTYYGRGDIPIGVYKGTTLVEMPSPYAKIVSEQCPHDLGLADQVPDVLPLYRKILAAQPDSSITMIAVGQMNNLVDLLATLPDEFSNLPGHELVLRKVAVLYVMAPYFNENGEYHRAYNFQSSPKAAAAFVKEWPTRIKFGEGILGHRHFIGSRLSETSVDNPCRIAFEAYFAAHPEQTNKKRHCADPLTVLYAVTGTKYFHEIGPGACDVREDGHTRWNASCDKQHYYNAQKLPVAELENIMESLLIKPPKFGKKSNAQGAGNRSTLAAVSAVLRPEIDSPWWTVAHNPDLGEFSNPNQQPVDFAVWQAADGSWQVCSCIRGTNCGGRTRLLFRWEGRRLTDSDWRPAGIAMQADEKYGEMAGGLQAPFVVKMGQKFVMAYGDSESICFAESIDGKQFERIVQPNGKTGVFKEGTGNRTRDPMLIRIGDRWHCYYTAYPNQEGWDFCRTTMSDLGSWSESMKVAFGGQAGTGPLSAECQFVVAIGGRYYLFRSQQYGQNALTTVYQSIDPMDFGINNDVDHLVCTLPVAAPEIIVHEEQHYIAALRPDLKGIQIAKLKWLEKEKSTSQ